MTPIPGSTSDAGATNTPNPGPSAPSEVQAVRSELSGSSDWDAVRSLAAILEPEAFDWSQPADEGWRERTQWVAIAHAAKVIELGWRRVSVDDDTVERVAEVLHAVRCDCTAWADEDLDLARAAVQALRDGRTA